MGRPKAWLPVGGEVMLQRVVRLVSQAVTPVVVVAAPDQAVPQLPGAIELGRDAAEGNGPLQGLAAGLAALTGRADAAFVTGCDAPLLRPEFIERLADLRGDADACVPVVGGFPRPLPGVYAVAILPVVHEFLGAGRYRLGALLDRGRSRLVTANDLAGADPYLDSLRNVNTPDDYARALAQLSLPTNPEPG